MVLHHRYHPQQQRQSMNIFNPIEESSVVKTIAIAIKVLVSQRIMAAPSLEVLVQRQQLLLAQAQQPQVEPPAIIHIVNQHQKQHHCLHHHLQSNNQQILVQLLLKRIDPRLKDPMQSQVRMRVFFK